MNRKKNNNLKTWMFNELVKCKKNPIYFIKYYCSIKNRQGDIVPCLLYPKQQKVIEMIHSAVTYTKSENAIKNLAIECVIEKARGTGISWAIALYSIYHIIFKKNATIGMMSYKKSLVCQVGNFDTLMGKCQIILKYLPSFFLGGSSYDIEDKTLVKNNMIVNPLNNSVIVAHSGQSGARGQRPDIEVIDEFAHFEIPNPETVRNNLESSALVNIFCSTPKGMNAFYNLVQSAVTFEGKISYHKPNKVSIPIQDCPFYSEDFFRIKEKQAIEDCRYHNFQQEYLMRYDIGTEGFFNYNWIIDNLDFYKHKNTQFEYLRDLIANFNYTLYSEAIFIGLDIADKGKDNTAITILRSNEVVCCKRIKHIDNVELVNQFIDTIYQLPFVDENTTKYLIYDSIGVGALFSSTLLASLEENHNFKITPYKANAKTKNNHDYKNTQAYDYEKLAIRLQNTHFYISGKQEVHKFRTENFLNNLMLFNHEFNMIDIDNLKKELTQIKAKYKFRTELMIDKKHGGRFKSPDLVDSLTMAFRILNEH